MIGNKERVSDRRQVEWHRNITFNSTFEMIIFSKEEGRGVYHREGVD